MRLFGDWKWYAALAALVLLTALVVWLPRPQAKPAAIAIDPSPKETADMPPTRPDPTVDEQESMLRYTVQDGDTVFGIARLFVVSEQDLRWANHLPEDGEVVAGDRIRMPAP